MITIRAERADDTPAVATVVEAAFGEAAEARLVEAIRSSDAYIPELSLVAEVDGRAVGHVMISTAELHGDDRVRAIANLSPLSVHPDHQRRGVGSALVREVLALADQRGEPLVVVEGDPAYYGRFGFEHSVPHGIHIHLPSWAPADAAQVVRLARHDPAYRGTVVYPPPFDAVLET